MDYYKELTHMIMDADESKICNVGIPAQVKKLETTLKTQLLMFQLEGHQQAGEFSLT
jgi:hypothetical protein